MSKKKERWISMPEEEMYSLMATLIKERQSRKEFVMRTKALMEDHKRLKEDNQWLREELRRSQKGEN